MHTPQHPDAFQPEHGPIRILISAGPTREPIDRVRYLGNRSSGRLGVELADHAARLGWHTTLLLGPTHLLPTEPAVRVKRFEQAEELRTLLGSELARHDMLVMAAAVADYRPAHPSRGKLRRTETGTLRLDLIPTPDLVAEASATARANQLLIGFALEPADTLLDSARSKLGRKGLDAIVANPLETIDAPDIRPTLITADGAQPQYESESPIMTKSAFAAWLLPLLADMLEAKRTRLREAQP